MLKAEKLKTYEPSKFKPGFMSFKHNGVHGICDPENQITYSRTPRTIQGVSHINKAMNHLAYPFIGELVVPGVDFETCNGLIRDHQEHQKIEFRIFNCFVPNVPFSSRLEYMREIHGQYFLSHPFIKFTDFYPVSTKEEFDAFYQIALDHGEEGVCLITPDHIYQPGKRGWNWMKRVPDISIEATVIDIFPGTAGKKYEDSLGAFLCKLDNGIQFKCGIFKGQTDEWRHEQWLSKEKLGCRITVKFKSYTKYGKPYQPRYIAERWDLGGA